GRICSSAQCSRSNCSGRLRSLRTTPITAKVEAMRIVSLIFALPLLAAASAPVQPVGPTLGQQLQQAKAERAAAESAAAKLQQEAARAQNGLDRLRAEQDASAQ